MRFDATTGETSDSSEDDHSNAEEFLLTDSIKNEVFDYLIYFILKKMHQ